MYNYRKHSLAFASITVTTQLQTCNNQPNILPSYIETATFDQQRNLQANGECNRSRFTFEVGFSFIKMATPNTLEEIQKLLEQNGINGEYKSIGEELFERVILFTVNGMEYKLIWYHNQSYLHIGEGNRAAFIPFKYIYLDVNYPIAGKCIAFCDEKFRKESIFDREYPFCSFRIPLPL